MSSRYDDPGIDAVRQLPLLDTKAVPARWEDQNDHVNVSYYMWRYTDSGWPMLGLIGIDESYFNERKLGLVDLENHIRYFNEIHVDDRVSVYGRYLGHDGKRIHGMVYFVNETRENVAASIEFMGINFDLKKRRTTSIPADVAVRLDSVTAEHQQLDWQVRTYASLPD